MAGGSWQYVKPAHSLVPVGMRIAKLTAPWWEEWVCARGLGRMGEVCVCLTRVPKQSSERLVLFALSYSGPTNIPRR